MLCESFQPLLRVVPYEKVNLEESESWMDSVMSRPYLISAIGTPLTDGEELHVEGLAVHLDAQANASIDGILVAGSMGAMQLLADRTYDELVAQSVKLWRRRGELLVGVGDTSFVRTRERIRTVNQYSVDGTVVLSPYFINFSQSELIDYFQALAAESKSPLYLYDLPARTRTSLTIDTVLTLSETPNIAGIKCSGDTSQTRRLKMALGDSDFRTILAKPMMIDSLFRSGMREHLDGVYAIVPQWMKKIADAVEQQDWQQASQKIAQLGNFLDVLVQYDVFPAMTELLNAQDVMGNYAPGPFARLDYKQREAILGEPIVQELLRGS